MISRLSQGFLDIISQYVAIWKIRGEGIARAERAGDQRWCHDTGRFGPDERARGPASLGPRFPNSEENILFGGELHPHILFSASSIPAADFPRIDLRPRLCSA
jgi:hypothetical protein